jgi:RNA polymerase sigma-70 factor, ECF subfamily
MDRSPGEITKLLLDMRGGDRNAEAKLMDLMYGELHRIAVRCMRGERPGHSLQPTVLVNEAYVHLIGSGEITFENRSHLLAIAANFMRRMLVDYARAGKAQKRGRGQRVDLDSQILFTSPVSEDFLALNEALESLAEMDPRQARVVELRYFGGLTNEETGAVLNLTSRTVAREWRVAKAWLYAALNPGANCDR